MAEAQLFRRDLTILTACASFTLVVHFIAGNGYGFHRDELQFLDDARHLQWGFVAYPPLTSFCGRIAIELFGISPQVLRLPAALVNAVSLVLIGLTARQLGGDRLAQVTALVAGLPLALAFSSVLQYNSFDLLAWMIIVFCTARVLATGDQRNWLGVGFGIGVGVLSKYSVAFPVVSLVAALLLMPSQRQQLRSRWFWYGILLAAIIASPNLIWLASHHFITLRMESFIHFRDVRLGRTSGFFSDQIYYMLLAFPLILAGLIHLLRSRRFRLLSVFFLGPLVLFALAKGRGYYLLPAYPVLYAAGAVATVSAVRRFNRPVQAAAITLVFAALLADATLVGWRFLPIFPVGSASWNWQMARSGDLRDEIGWPELVRQVAQVRDALPAGDLPRLAILANNYGEAGAIALFGPQYHLPVPISSTNTFHMRGYGAYEPETVIVLGDTLEGQLRNFESCQVAAQVAIPYGIRNEEAVDHPVILVCRHLLRPLAEVWPHSQEFG